MTTTRLQSKEPERLIYADAFLNIEVLGGVRLEGLDRMRVTLKVELRDSSRPAVRHNLDLYNDTQLEKFIRKIAERMEVGSSVVSAGLSELTGELERYRLDRIKEGQAEHTEAKALGEEEKGAAITHLRHPRLLEATLQDLQQSGIQGEPVNSLILYLAMTSRKTGDPLSVICLARSGVGKSYLMEKVAGCIPGEDTREHTQFSGNSFYYYRREEIRGKVFLIEDLDGAQAVLFPIRELQTKKRISKTVTVKDKNGQLRTVTLVVEGPVSVIGCTTKEKVYEDNANRALLVYLDGSRDQDDRIMDYQKRRRAGLVDQTEESLHREKLQNMQRMLQPLRVINPYALYIDLPKEIFKPRRTLPLLLSFIEAISFYHQYQREQKADPGTGEIYIEVEPSDIEQGFRLLSEVLFRKSDELSGASREFFQWLQGWSKREKKKTFYAHDIRRENRLHPRTLNRYLQELTAYGLLQITGGNPRRTGYSYKLNPNRDYETLQKSLKEQVEKVMQNIREAYHKRQMESMSAGGKKRSKTAGQQQDSKSDVLPEPLQAEQ